MYARMCKRMHVYMHEATADPQIVCIPYDWACLSIKKPGPSACLCSFLLPRPTKVLKFSSYNYVQPPALSGGVACIRYGAPSASGNPAWLKKRNRTWILYYDFSGAENKKI